MNIETQCLHEGYKPKNGEPQALPIYQTTTYRYESTKQVGDLFDLSAEGFFYTRLANPTVDAVEKKIAALEGGVGALCTSAGQAATLISVMNIASAGDHILCSINTYGGTINLLGVTLQKFGVECTFINPDASEEEIQDKIKENTKLIFGETIANPSIAIFDIEKFAKIAHKNNIPLIVDNTFATPYLCKPIEYGADIVVHSTSKYLDGHAIQLGGVIVDSGNFNWSNGKFKEFTEPDETYHGVVYTEHFGKAAYIAKARTQLMRDLGAAMTPQAAFYLNLGIETLPVRMDKHCENAQKVAEFLSKSDKLEFVNYPTLPGNKYKELSKKYCPKGPSGVISFSVKGGRDSAIKFMDSLKLCSNVVHVADIRTCVLHPASSTHRQLTDEQLIAGGITPGLIRLSVGVENIDDILADLQLGLSNI